MKKSDLPRFMEWTEEAGWYDGQELHQIQEKLRDDSDAELRSLGRKLLITSWKARPWLMLADLAIALLAIVAITAFFVIILGSMTLIAHLLGFEIDEWFPHWSAYVVFFAVGGPGSVLVLSLLGALTEPVFNRLKETRAELRDLIRTSRFGRYVIKRILRVRLHG